MAFAGCLVLCANAQEAKEATDSLTMEMLVQDLPEVMVKGSRPIVKAEQGKLSYNMPQLLKQLPAAQLAKAEVMLAAPARLHVRGMAINIVTKDASGTRQVSGQLRGGWKQSKYGTGFGDAFFSLQRNKLGLDAQYSFVDGRAYGENSRSANHPLNGGRVAYGDETWTKSEGITHDYRLGMSYAFSGNHRLDAAYTGKWDKSDSDNRTTGSSMSETHSDSHVYLHNIDLNYALPFGLNISGSYLAIARLGCRCSTAR